MRSTPLSADLAEDVGKCDQYVRCDASHDSSALHKTLYHERLFPHPGSVFYVIACRVALGLPVRIRDNSKEDAVSIDHNYFAFANENYRELASVPDVSPPITHHSLIAEPPGGQFREFIIFHTEYVLPEYLIAYQRS